MAVFHAGQIAAQQPGPPLDVSLRKPPLAALAGNHLTDVYFWFFFRHRQLASTTGYPSSYPLGAQAFFRGNETLVREDTNQWRRASESRCLARVMPQVGFSRGKNPPA